MQYKYRVSVQTRKSSLPFNSKNNNKRQQQYNNNDDNNNNKKSLSMAQYEVKEYSQQSGYIPQPAMSIPQTQPQVVTRNQGRGTWKASLFDCFSVPGLCFKTCF